MRLQRTITWLMPGLAFKRWVFVAGVGVFFLMLGGALILNLQPITMTIDFLKLMAQVMPSHISGPLLFLSGMILLYFGLRRTFRTMSSALGATSMATIQDNPSLLDALYHQSKLLRGPHVVAIGGGTGLSSLLRGLKHYTSNITAVVTVGDDGGSSGRLRLEQGIIPPGDIRNCIAALADEEHLITSLFQYRFQTGQGLEGHSFGNLFLTAMSQITGDMMSAIRASSKVLNIRGAVLPASLENVTLTADLEDGREIVGESNIPKAKGKIKRLRCVPPNPKALPEALLAIAHADLILIGPGSLYTSVMPNLLLGEICAAVSKSRAPKLYIANLVTQPGETDGMSVADHIEAILDHAAYPNILDAVIVNKDLPPVLVAKYQTKGYEPIEKDIARCMDLGIEVIESQLVDEAEAVILRHQPKTLAREMIRWYKKRKKPQIHALYLPAHE